MVDVSVKYRPHSELVFCSICYKQYKKYCKGKVERTLFRTPEQYLAGEELRFFIECVDYVVSLDGKCGFEQFHQYWREGRVVYDVKDRYLLNPYRKLRYDDMLEVINLVMIIHRQMKESVK